ncbi:MAG: YcaO-like family protein [Pseudomonadales bacterium]|nr:YcaO-like family protein [Pseudomonadales bacterium]
MLKPESSSVEFESLLKNQFSHWTIVDRCQESLSIHKLNIQLCGIAAKNKSGNLATGSSAALEQMEVSRANFELLERMVICDVLNGSRQHRLPLLDNLNNNGPRTITVDEAFPQSSNPSQYQWSKSNGIALHTSVPMACQAAGLELIERDQILASWFGLSRPAVVNSILIEDISESFSAHYKIKCARLSEDNVTLFDRKVFVFGIFLIPEQNTHLPFFGYGAAFTQDAAILKCKSELLQQVGFLAESKPTLEPVEVSPVPEYHLAYFSNPEHFDQIFHWLNGDYYKPNCRRLFTQTPKIEYAVLPVGCEKAATNDQVFVVKAFSKELIPLIFGQYDYSNYLITHRHWQTHPIA